MANETTASGSAPPAEEPGLKKAISPKLLLFFVIGDIVGTTIYTLTGKVAGKVGGALWIPFLVAFLVAFLTAMSYLELVGKYPKAAGAALYVHKAFGIQFVTFMVAFAVMCSGITSASSAAQAFGGDNMAAIVNFFMGTEGDLSSSTSLILALGFILILAGINFRGVSESVKLNVVLTTLSLVGLIVVILAGAYAIFTGITAEGVSPDPGRLLQFNSSAGPLLGVTSATALAFFAMVGFEDSVNMAEETKDPIKTFPRAMLMGMAITAGIYLLIALVTSTLVPTDELKESTAPLMLVMKAAAPWFPVVLFAVFSIMSVTNTALINMMMASRLLYGMANEGVVPRAFNKVHAKRQTPWVGIVFTSVIGLILVSTLKIEDLGSATSLLLLMVFGLVNVALLVLRRQPSDHEHFRAPAWVPWAGAATCFFFASPVSGREPKEYLVIAILLGLGLVFWLINYAVKGKVDQVDPEKIAG